MSHGTTPQPSDNATDVGASLVASDDLQREVLLEAVEAGKESGRTVCGANDVHEPTDRDFGAVQLPGCPLDKFGMVHGGGGHNLRSPEHSLLDMANVLLGSVEASLVVGTRTSDLMLAPTSDTLEAAQTAYQRAIGVEVTSPNDVIAALTEERVESPPQARQVVRSDLAGLFKTVETRHPDAEERADPGRGPKLPDGRPVVAESVRGTLSDAAETPAMRFGNTVAAVRVLVGSVFDFDAGGTQINVAQLVASEFASALVLTGFLWVLGGRPSALVSERMA